LAIPSYRIKSFMQHLRVLLAALMTCCGLIGCASQPPESSGAPSAPLSDVFAPSNDPASPDWYAVNIRFKTPTVYSRAVVSDVPCVLAEANGSWSLHVSNVPEPFAKASKLSWRWHVPALVSDANNGVSGLDDAAARVVVAFKGDRSKLDAADRSTMSLAKALGGWELPYAAIQYIWEAQAPVETVIPNANIARIKKIVVRSGSVGLTQWQSFERDVKADFRKAFPNEEPGDIESIGLMTDTDSLGGVTKACYADIRLR
jgi:hypothetical protein